MSRPSVIETVIIDNEIIDIVKSDHFKEQYYNRPQNKPTVDFSIAIQKAKEALPVIITEWKNKNVKELTGVIQSVSTDLNMIYVISKNQQTTNIDLVLVTVVQKPLNQFQVKKPTDYKVKVSSKKQNLVNNIYASKFAAGIFNTNKLLGYLVQKHIISESFPEIGMYLCGDDSIFYVADKKANSIEIVTADFRLENNIFICEVG